MARGRWLTRRRMAASYAVLSVLVVLIGAAVRAPAQTETVLHSFSGGKGGSAPSGGLVFDTAGNLYGTTLGGGNLQNCSHRGCGTVFELSPRPTGSWTYSAIYSFSGVPDGAYPDSLVLDGAGNIYGTAFGGGQSGGGTAFELTRAGLGWTESELYAFAGNINNADVTTPIGMIFDSAGNLYGTGEYGASSCHRRVTAFGRKLFSTVSQVVPTADGHWLARSSTLPEICTARPTTVAILLSAKATGVALFLSYHPALMDGNTRSFTLSPATRTVRILRPVSQSTQPATSTV